MYLAACRRGDGMPTDGESLMTLIASCGGSGSNAVASVSAMRDASQTLFVRVGALRRSGKGQGTGGGFTAADAKREGGLLAKIFNTALKQQTALKEGQDEAAKQLLSTAEHALGLLHEMAPHLAFMPTDLDKLSQNLIQKLIDRGLGKRARAQSEAMLVRLAERLCGKKLAAAHASVDKENACKGNTMAAKQVSGKIEMNDSTSGWRAGNTRLHLCMFSHPVHVYMSTTRKLKWEHWPSSDGADRDNRDQ